MAFGILLGLQFGTQGGFIPFEEVEDTLGFFGLDLPLHGRGRWLILLARLLSAVLLLVLLAVLLLVLFAVLLLVLLAVLLLVLLAVLLLLLLLVLLAVLLLVLVLFLLLLRLAHGIRQAQIVPGVRILRVESKGLLIRLNGPLGILSAEQDIAHVVPRIGLDGGVIRRAGRALERAQRLLALARRSLRQTSVQVELSGAGALPSTCP